MLLNKYYVRAMQSHTVDGEEIRKLRELRGLSGTLLASSAQLTAAALYRIEGGKTQPRASTVLRIANALGVPMKDLLVAEKVA